MNTPRTRPWTIGLLMVATAFGFSVSNAAPGFAQSDTPASVDAGAVADAYGSLSVFILNVAAGLDGVPKDPQGEQVFHDAFAQQMLTAFAGLDPQDQQSLAELPDLRTAVFAAWPRLPDSQRSAIAEQWRQSVQSDLASVPCPMYDALARAYLLPGGDAATVKANGDHLVQCWNQYPELARGRNGEDLHAQRQQQQNSAGGSDAIYRGMMNAEVTQYAGTMNMISIMSGDPYRWTVK
jgi:hypothetical protein